ncbi:MAG: DUF3122 domain-containing protein [Leptolyngbya sp. SIO1D8]|nr:DUF3122 domain-containing protein [Leptolyngbya sp. SIO1D8]
MIRRLSSYRYPRLVISLLVALVVWVALPGVAQASIHTYHERPGQVTYRSRQSLRDYGDRAWQAIAFKRIQRETLQGIYLRLVGFPGAVTVEPQKPIVLISTTGQQWQLSWDIDPQTESLPDSVGQYDLQPLLASLTNALPLEMQISLTGMDVAEIRIAPFVVKEWLQIASSQDSPSPVAPPLS